MRKLFIFALLLALVVVGPAFARKVAVLPDLMNPVTFVVDGDRFFVSEGIHIYIYNLKDFKLLKKFGKEGEGPREFKAPADRGGLRMTIQPGYIYISTLGKISHFTRDGEYIKEMRNPTLSTFYHPFGSRHAGMGFAQENQKLFLTVNIFDPALKKIKEIHRQEHFYQRGKFNPLGQLPFIIPIEDKIVVAGDIGIMVFSDKGEKEVTIDYPFDRLKVKDSHKKEAVNFFKTTPGIKQNFGLFKDIMAFPESFPYFQRTSKGDDKICVQTYKRKDNKAELIIFDLKGKLIKKTFIPLADKNIFESYPYSIHKGKVYQLVENTTGEEWELHIHPVE